MEIRRSFFSPAGLDQRLIRRWPLLILCFAATVSRGENLIEPIPSFPSGEGRAGPTVGAPETHRGEVPFPQPVNDPIEPLNRVFFGFNDGLIRFVLSPAERGYRWVVPEGGRRSIKKAGHNLAFPVRLINTMLQGKLKGSAVETGRFAINTTVGVLGFFDPATRVGLGNYDEDFGQTFGWWGAGPGFYLVLPVMGPSSGRDAVGGIGDMALNPATYVPGLGLFLNFNDTSFRILSYERLAKVEKDPYAIMRDLWGLNRKREVMDFQITSYKSDPAPTVEAIFLDVRDPAFPARMKVETIRAPTTGEKLHYSYWLQPAPAPLVFILPGVGGHRMSESTMAIAEMLYRNGHSVAAISNALNWEFIEQAGTPVVPGYPPTDADDVYQALGAVSSDLRERHGEERFTATGLVGMSLGATHALYISDIAEKAPIGGLRFDRYIAINPPPDLPYALKKLDGYYNAPLAWPAEEREERIERTLMKAIALSQGGDLTPSTELPFDRVESHYLIGLVFKLTLRDIIYTSQKKKDLGILSSGVKKLKRQEVYDEIARYSYTDYLSKFVLPYYLNFSGMGLSEDELFRRANLHSIEAELRANPRIRVYVNENDFLVSAGDLRWFEELLGERLVVFAKGGHLGNLHLQEVQDRIALGLDDLKRR